MNRNAGNLAEKLESLSPGLIVQVLFTPQQGYYF
jgi:hypothetical protein